jgi:hypothetical protein
MCLLTVYIVANHEHIYNLVYEELLMDKDVVILL